MTHVEPRKSAACIILTEEPTPRALLVRRSDKLRFMPGHHAFPGGRISDDEPIARVSNTESEERARAVHALAREIFEETGILAAIGLIPSEAELRAARLAILEDEKLFDPFLERHNLVIDAEEFVDAGIWITPKGSPIRFHAAYHLLRWRGEARAEVIEGELSGADWMEPGEARLKWRQGEIQLPPPVAYVLQMLEAFGLPAALEPIRRTTHVVPDTPGRIEYRCGINVIPLRAPALPPSSHTNCVAIGEREILLVDPATPFPDEQAVLKQQLDHLLELGGKIGAILVSHSHPDHIGAVEFVRNLYGAPVWAHEATAPRVPFKIDRFLKHDEVVEAAGAPPWRVRCLHTPGHDPGHLAFLEETTRTLLCGDMIAERGTIIVPHERGDEMTLYLASLESLLRDDYDMMIPAHGLAIMDPPAKIREYIAHRLAREAKIKKAVDSGLTDLKEILAAAYDDVAPAVWPLAEKSLRAHLARLGFQFSG